MSGARGRRLRRRGPLGIGGELRASSAAGLGRGAPGTGGRHHGQTSEQGRGQRPFGLFPGQGSPAQGAVRGTACGPWGFGPWGPDVGPWTLRSGVEQLHGAGGRGERMEGSGRPSGLGWAKGRSGVGGVSVGRIHPEGRSKRCLELNPWASEGPAADLEK